MSSVGLLHGSAGGVEADLASGHTSGIRGHRTCAGDRLTDADGKGEQQRHGGGDVWKAAGANGLRLEHDGNSLGKKRPRSGGVCCNASSAFSAIDTNRLFP